MLIRTEWHGALIRMRAHYLNVVETDRRVTPDGRSQWCVRFAFSFGAKF